MAVGWRNAAETTRVIGPM